MHFDRGRPYALESCIISHDADDVEARRGGRRCEGGPGSSERLSLSQPSQASVSRLGVRTPGAVTETPDMARGVWSLPSLTWRGRSLDTAGRTSPEMRTGTGCSHSDYILILAQTPLRLVSPHSSSPWTCRPSSLDPSTAGTRTMCKPGSPSLAFRSTSSRLEVRPHRCPSIPTVAEHHLRAQHIWRCPLSPRSRKPQGDRHCYYRPAASYSQGRLQCQACAEHSY